MQHIFLTILNIFKRSNCEKADNCLSTRNLRQSDHSHVTAIFEANLHKIYFKKCILET